MQSQHDAKIKLLWQQFGACFCLRELLEVQVAQKPKAPALNHGGLRALLGLQRRSARAQCDALLAKHPSLLQSGKTKAVRRNANVMGAPNVREARWEDFAR